MLGDLFSADQVVDKELFARRTVVVRTLPNDGARVLRTVAPGERVGRVFSFVGGTGGRPLWWQLYDNGTLAFVQHDPGAFDRVALTDQGALTVADERKKREEENSLLPGISLPGNPLPALGVVAALAIGALVLVNSVGKMAERLIK